MSGSVYLDTLKVSEQKQGFSRVLRTGKTCWGFFGFALVGKAEVYLR